MSEISEFYVILDKKETIYRPGESVHGSVKLKVTKTLKLKELKLECFGEAEVTWPEWYGTYTKYCYNRRTYLELDAVLFPSQGKSLFHSFVTKKPRYVLRCQISNRLSL